MALIGLYAFVLDVLISDYGCNPILNEEFNDDSKNC